MRASSGDRHDHALFGHGPCPCQAWSGLAACRQPWCFGPDRAAELCLPCRLVLQAAGCFSPHAFKHCWHCPDALPGASSHTASPWWPQLWHTHLTDLSTAHGVFSCTVSFAALLFDAAYCAQRVWPLAHLFGSSGAASMRLALLYGWQTFLCPHMKDLYYRRGAGSTEIRMWTLPACSCI